MAIDPQAKAVLEEIERASRANPKPRNAKEKLAQARRATGALARFSAAAPRTVEVSEAAFRADDGFEVPLRVYRPGNGGRFLLWFHGGGAIAGSLDTHQAPLMALAERTGRTIVSVGYRLAPEWKFPTQHEDCLGAARFLASGGLGAAQGWAIGGDSIGGLYATATARALRTERAANPPVAQVLLYPNTDLRDIRAFASLRENEGYVMTRESLEYEANTSIPAHTNRLESRASPILADDLAGLPPCFLATCELDPLRDEGELYGRRLEESGVAITHKRYAGMIHAFLQMNGRIDRAGELMDDIAGFLDPAGRG